MSDLRKEALRIRSLKKNHRYKRLWTEYFRLHGLDSCSECGYSKCAAAIDYHHTVPSVKGHGIAPMMKLPITPERVSELNKCVPLCANCHRELHAKDRSVRRLVEQAKAIFDCEVRN